jgi:hypothetical protein
MSVYLEPATGGRHLPENHLCVYRPPDVQQPQVVAVIHLNLRVLRASVVFSPATTE